MDANLGIEGIAEYMDWFFSPGAEAPVGSADGKAETAGKVFGELFLRAPDCDLDAGKSAAFRDLWESALRSPGDLSYTLDYLKWEFLTYLSRHEDMLFHGSSRAAPQELVPGPQTRWDQVPIEAVFATSDPIWPMFFATMNWEVLQGSVRNGGFAVETGDGSLERYYFFSADTGDDESDVLMEGHVHIVPRSGFTTNPAPVRIDEWHSTSAVPVLARLRVEPDVFPFREMISRHTSDEPVQVTWHQYRESLSHR